MKQNQKFSVQTIQPCLCSNVFEVPRESGDCSDLQLCGLYEIATCLLHIQTGLDTIHLVDHSVLLTRPHIYIVQGQTRRLTPRSARWSRLHRAARSTVHAQAAQRQKRHCLGSHRQICNRVIIICLSGLEL